MSVDYESQFSDWSMGVKRADNTIWDTMRYLGKVVLAANDMKIRMINWLAMKIKAVKGGGLLDREEFANAAAMLDSKSVTVSGCAKELLAAAHKKQPEEAKTTLLHVLAAGNRAAKMAAADALVKTGDVSHAADICAIMPEFNEMGRKEIARMAERLVRDGNERADTEGIEKELKAGASKLRASGQDVQQEFRRYYSQMRDAARMASIGLKRLKKRKHGELRHKKLRVAC